MFAARLLLQCPCTAGTGCCAHCCEPHFFKAGCFKAFSCTRALSLCTCDCPSVLPPASHRAVHLYMLLMVQGRYPYKLAWLPFIAASCAAWLGSAAFHARDTPATERVDYAAAFSTVVASCVALVLRCVPAAGRCMPACVVLACCLPPQITQCVKHRTVHASLPRTCLKCQSQIKCSSCCSRSMCVRRVMAAGGAKYNLPHWPRCSVSGWDMDTSRCKFQSNPSHTQLQVATCALCCAHRAPCPVAGPWLPHAVHEV